MPHPVLVLLKNILKSEKPRTNLLPCVYFKEWVTEDPFVISPRITFAVSVRLLGGLMALGYTIATILKRSSHVLSDDRICVKLDWLEQLNRHYVQVMLEYLYNAILLLSNALVILSFVYNLLVFWIWCLYAHVSSVV
jgi:hypothetical protein